VINAISGKQSKKCVRYFRPKKILVVAMSRLCSCGVALFVLTMAAVMGGCSSSSPPISVSLSPSSPQAIDQGQTVGAHSNRDE
jgi:hypothetical protein